MAVALGGTLGKERRRALGSGHLGVGLVAVGGRVRSWLEGRVGPRRRQSCVVSRQVKEGPVVSRDVKQGPEEVVPGWQRPGWCWRAGNLRPALPHVPGRRLGRCIQKPRGLPGEAVHSAVGHLGDGLLILRAMRAEGALRRTKYSWVSAQDLLRPGAAGHLGLLRLRQMLAQRVARQVSRSGPARGQFCRSDTGGGQADAERGAGWREHRAQPRRRGLLRGMGTLHREKKPAPRSRHWERSTCRALRPSSTSRDWQRCTGSTILRGASRAAGAEEGFGGLVRRFGSLGCGRSGEAKARARACGGPVVSRDVKQWPEEEARAGPLRQPGVGRGVVVCSLRACPSLRVARPGPGRA